MKTKHTKGEWEVYQWANEGIDFFHIRPKQKLTNLIATIHRWKGHIDKREANANAKIITAAPEMLEALNEMQEYISHYFPIGTDPHLLNLFKLHQKALTAIKKATE